MGWGVEGGSRKEAGLEFSLETELASRGLKRKRKDSREEWD